MSERVVHFGVRATNRQALVLFEPGVVGDTEAPYLRIVLRCGNIREYTKKEDVPELSVRCNCNEVDYEHWFIIYEEDVVGCYGMPMFVQ